MGENQRIVGAILDALRFRDANPGKLASLSESDWQPLLEYADLSHLTLSLGTNCREYLPGWVQERIAENLRDNCKRWDLIKATYEEVQSAFLSAGVQHVVIKGFAQCPDFAPSSHARFQSDIDLYCPDDSLMDAAQILRKMGYEALVTSEKADHLPTMIRRGSWKWRGNSYDPEMPLSIELHNRFWNRARMRLGPDHLQQFWSRREIRHSGWIAYPALHPVDNLGFSALQVLRDLLDNTLSAHKVYELAYLLNHKANDDDFWRMWSTLHDEDLRACEAVSFCLARACFGCELARPIAEQIAVLPRIVRTWIPLYGSGSLTTHRSSEKDAVWIHLALVNSARNKLAILMRAFLRTPDPYKLLVESASVQGGGRWMQYAYYGIKRIPRHALSFPRMLYRGGRTLVACRTVSRSVTTSSEGRANLDLERGA